MRPTRRRRRGLMCCANARQAGKFEIFRSRRRGEKTSKNKEMGYIPQGMEIEALPLSPWPRSCQETKRHYHAASRVRPSVRRTLLIQQSSWWAVVSDMRARGRGRTVTSSPKIHFYKSIRDGRGRLRSKEKLKPSCRRTPQT